MGKDGRSGPGIQECNRSVGVSVLLSKSEYKKLEKAAWLKGISMSAFIRKALEDEHKKILDEEVRQYEHSGLHSAVC